MTSRADTIAIGASVFDLWCNFMGIPQQLENTLDSFVAGSDTQPSKPASSFIPSQRALPSTLQLSSDERTFLVAFKARAYDRLGRVATIDAVVDAVRRADPSWHVNPTDFKVLIQVNVLRSIACISLLERFSEFRKYNLAEMAAPTSQFKEKTSFEPPNIDHIMTKEDALSIG
ncbi:unnamed protein product [Protopolystoma xenopodis]|uniref:THUMP domain-containing protein n=1 Tax=Protopolystoma xenopodis TaxID=117903 RepID=A0A3S4ZQL7_9PLAT|nr:unnamed protein product [Protopolystoma xenopodis]